MQQCLLIFYWYKASFRAIIMICLKKCIFKMIYTFMTSLIKLFNDVKSMYNLNLSIGKFRVKCPGKTREDYKATAQPEEIAYTITK